MKRPLITFGLCTVRAEHDCYLDHPEWGNLDRIVAMLEAQTFKDFELVIVDGLHKSRVKDSAYGRCDVQAKSFSVTHVPPLEYSPWMRQRKVAIAAYRNTMLAYAKGELIVNLDDAATLPPTYAALFASAWRMNKTALAVCWPHLGDQRRPGRVDQPGMVFGFGSYPLELAVRLNGYNEAFDGGQGLEDMEWSHRLFRAGLQQALVAPPGFNIEPQGPHSDDAIDPVQPIVKCCNAAWHVCQEEACVDIAGSAALWGAPGRYTPEQVTRRAKLCSPCFLLNADGSCQHHGGRARCAYPTWSSERTEVLDILLKEPHPVIDLEGMRLELGHDPLL